MNGIIVIAVICVALAVWAYVRTKRFIADSVNNAKSGDRGKKSGYILLPYRGNTDNLERLVKSYYWEEVFERESLGREIILVSLERCENDLTAKQLEREFSIVRATDIEGLCRFLNGTTNEIKE